jgi:hypothetical protein
MVQAPIKQPKGPPGTYSSYNIHGIDPLTPCASTLCKLGSIAVHVQEMLTPSGRYFDRIALEQLLKDAEVISWLGAMRQQDYVPEMRS